MSLEKMRFNAELPRGGSRYSYLYSATEPIQKTVANMYNTGRVTAAENAAIEWQELARMSANIARNRINDGDDISARRWQEHAALDAQQARWNMGIE